MKLGDLLDGLRNDALHNDSLYHRPIVKIGPITFWH